MKIGIVGCGLIGHRRGLVAQQAGDEVLLVADLNPEVVGKIASSLQTEGTQEWQAVTGHPQIPLGRHRSEPRCDIPAKRKPPLP